ncbi:MAG: hypothetical protein IT345_11960 [Trueperaceae bacterium]|nr:hypothetical protein [Trueperaceae bacterium]
MSDRPTVEQGGRVIHIPMTLKKQGGRKEIIVPEGLPQSQPRSPAQEPLVVALARAFHWQDLIDGGRYSSITELARALDVDRSYVGRITRLTLLAPDIVEAILRGVEPSGLSLQRLTKQLPVEWPRQRAALGFPSR